MKVQSKASGECGVLELRSALNQSLCLRQSSPEQENLTPHREAVPQQGQLAEAVDAARSQIPVHRATEDLGQLVGQLLDFPPEPATR